MRDEWSSSGGFDTIHQPGNARFFYDTKMGFLLYGLPESHDGV